MTEQFYPHLSERILEHILPNGLVIRVIPKVGFARKYAFFAANYGSIDTSFHFRGQHLRTPTRDLSVAPGECHAAVCCPRRKPQCFHKLCHHGLLLRLHRPV